MKKIIFLTLLSVLSFSCNNINRSDYSALEEQQEVNKHPGKKLMETNCYACHSPVGSHNDRIGPPMIAIKKHYINSNVSKEEFTASLQDWLINPNIDDAKMLGAVKRFGIMPKQPFSENTIKQIADYIYDFDIELPEWFEVHFNEEKGKHKGKGISNGKMRALQKQK